LHDLDDLSTEQPERGFSPQSGYEAMNPTRPRRGSSLATLTELKFSNSMIEAWWRSLKHQWLFLHSLDSVTTVRRLVAFYVDEHNRVLPHSAFRGQTPDEMYFDTGDAVPADLRSRAAAARRTRAEANRSASCQACPSVDAAA
jgi:hypothetical protein